MYGVLYKTLLQALHCSSPTRTSVIVEALFLLSILKPSKMFFHFLISVVLAPCALKILACLQLS